METNRELFICKCGNVEHQLIFSHSDDKDDKEIYLSVHLIPDNFWRRIKNAVKYILGYRSRYGHFDEFILDPEDADKLQKVVTILKNKNS